MTSRGTAELERLVSIGVPSDALVFYGRWLQLETWLRELVYVELRAKYGSAWTTHLKGTAPRRAAGDTKNAYMASADAGELLAYADVSHLFELIEDQWELFEPLLPQKRRWQGSTDELRDLRNRNAHCRRPHRDDVARIEQFLRDLERGAQLFYVSYLDTRPLGRSRDPVSRAWVHGRHATADRLLEHAKRQYDVRFRLGYSVRPWAAWPKEDRVTGSPGALWHAKWTLGPNEVRIADLWADMPASAERLLVHLLLDASSVTATFAAVDPADDIADSIGDLFDAILTTSRSRNFVFDAHWRAGADELPRRAQIDTPLTDIDPPNSRGISIFNANAVNPKGP